MLPNLFCKFISFTFKVFTAAEIVVVKVTTATSNETTLTLTTDYTIETKDKHKFVKFVKNLFGI